MGRAALRGPRTGEGEAPPGSAGWLRALGLLAGASLLWVGNPVVLVGVPFLLLAIFRPVKGPLAWGLVGVTAALVTLRGGASGFWFVERGWALLLGGCFVALSLRWPGGRFLPKGLGAVTAAFAATGLLFRARPQDWRVTEWLVTERMDWAMSVALQAARMNTETGTLPLELETQAVGILEAQQAVFPALLGLASLSALGLAWWLHHRIGAGPGETIGSLKEFRFNDQLVWILILGFLFLLGSSGLLSRLGTNTVVFMGALYALRGVGVVLFLTGGLSLFGGTLLLLGFVFVAPVLIVGAFVIGLGDTWLNLRARRGASSSS